MGEVRCVTHGPQQGPLCCEHVLEAISDASQTPACVDPHGLVRLSLDFLDDGEIILSVVLCRECAMQYGRTDGEVLAWNDGAPAVLPWTCPSCSGCLERWTHHSTAR